MELDRDEQLWKLAHKRIEFRRSVANYIVVNVVLWLIWWFTAGIKTGFTGYPWPVWVMFIWGLAIARQYFESEKPETKSRAEIEYERLLQRRRFIKAGNIDGQNT